MLAVSSLTELDVCAPPGFAAAFDSSAAALRQLQTLRLTVQFAGFESRAEFGNTLQHLASALAALPALLQLQLHGRYTRAFQHEKFDDVQWCRLRAVLRARAAASRA